MGTIICESHFENGDTNPVWLEERKKGVTASDTAKLMTGESWIHLWGQKTGRIEKESLDDVERVQWGHLMEGVILKAYSLDRYAGRPVYPSGELMRSDEHPWMLATLDARTEHPTHGMIPLDAKNVDKFMEYKWEAGVPDKFLWQTRHQAIIEEATASSVACALGGNRLLWGDDELTPANTNSILEVTSRFWWHVENDVPPPVDDGSRDSKKGLHYAYEPEPGTHVGLDRSFTVLDQEYEHIVAILKTRTEDSKELVARKQQIENMVQSAMTTHTEANLDNGTRWLLKRVERKAYTAKASSYSKLMRKPAR